jgi:hypothetical protein
MATAGDIITLALKDAQIIDENETPSAALMADSLTTLNQLIGLWQSDSLFVYGTTEITFAPTGALSYTIGTGGDIAATRPLKINYAFHVLDGINYPMLSIAEDLKQYQELNIQALSSNPDVIFYSETYPLGTLYIYPQPNSGTMHLGVDIQLPAYTTHPDAISLHPRYEMPLRFNLAKIILSMFGKEVTPGINNLANNSLRMLKRSNVKVKELNLNGVTNRTERSDFYSGFLR